LNISMKRNLAIPIVAIESGIAGEDKARLRILQSVQTAAFSLLCRGLTKVSMAKPRDRIPESEKKQLAGARKDVKSLFKPSRKGRIPGDPKQSSVLGQHAVVEKPFDEPALVHATQFGDIAAFEQLVRLHERQLLAVAERVTRNHEDAQEAVQDAFLKLFQKINQFRGNSKLSTWLFRVTVNESCMKLRKKRKKEELMSAGTARAKRMVANIADSAPSPEEVLTASELWKNLITASQNLLPRLRPILWLRVAEGLSVEQIAVTLNLPTSAVKARLHRSRSQIRSQLIELSARDRLHNVPLKPEQNP